MKYWGCFSTVHTYPLESRSPPVVTVVISMTVGSTTGTQLITKAVWAVASGSTVTVLPFGGVTEQFAETSASSTHRSPGTKPPTVTVSLLPIPPLASESTRIVNPSGSSPPPTVSVVTWMDPDLNSQKTSKVTALVSLAEIATVWVDSPTTAQGRFSSIMSSTA